MMNIVRKRYLLHRIALLTLFFFLSCGFLIYRVSFFKADTENNSNIIEIKTQETSIYLKRNGTHLRLFGQPYTFTGINAYSIASLNGINAGCGGQIDDLDVLFSTLRPNSIVRFWGWQGSMVTNVKTKLPDWTGIDRVISTAAKYNQRVIISLSDQAGTCDDGRWKDMAWYNGGFKQVYNPTGLTPLSYWDFVQLIVTRYKDSPTIAMWELVNEPESANCMPGYNGTGCYGHQSCPDSSAAAKSLRYFFDTVGGKIKELDPNHLVESGVIGTGQCGADNWNYQYIHESPGIDIASYHDYGDHDSPMPGDQWNGLQIRLNQMQKIQKPLIIGEAGMLAQDNSTVCMNFAARRDKIEAKMNKQFRAGVVGYIPWSWASDNAGVCNYDIPPTDPLVKLLHDVPLREVTPLPTPTGKPTATPTIIPLPISPSVSSTVTVQPNPFNKIEK